jgi:hypothetical protein
LGTFRTHSSHRILLLLLLHGSLRRYVPTVAALKEDPNAHDDGDEDDANNRITIHVRCVAVNDRYVLCAPEEPDPDRQDEMDGIALCGVLPTRYLASIRAAQVPVWHIRNKLDGTDTTTETEVISNADRRG